MLRLVLASGNAHKVQEFRHFLNPFANHLQLLSLQDFPGHPALLEEGQSFVENALAKAQVIARHSQLLTLADDSGLEVDALAGAPGIYSARYANPKGPCNDQANNEKLLRELQSVPAAKRTARFRCVLALVDPKLSQSWTFEGCCEGLIGLEGSGSGGFGYDPLFILTDAGCTMAELSFARKNQISHRAQAFAKLTQDLPQHLEGSHSL